jgi:hypothetical protein
MTVLAAVLVGDNWFIGAEVLRVGNGHLSYRTERLPWRQYRPAIIAAALGVFWLAQSSGSKTERVQAAERRVMFGTDDRLYSNRPIARLWAYLHDLTFVSDVAGSIELYRPLLQRCRVKPFPLRAERC